MCKHSDAFHMLAAQMTAAKQRGFTIIVCSAPPPVPPQMLLIAVLHDVANKAYLDNSGINEDELEELHALIDGKQHV